LNTKAKRKIGIALLRFQQIECFKNTRRAVPFYFHTRARDILTFFGRRRNECPRVQPKLAKKLSIFLLNLAEPFLRVVHEIHLVYDDNDMLDAKHAQQVGVTSALFPHPFVRTDHKDRCVRSRCASNHVLQEFLVPRGINDGVLAPRRSKRNFGRIDCDVLFLLLKKRIEQKGKFKLHSLRGTRFLYLFDLPFGQRTGVVQNATDERGLSMVNMTDEDDAQLLLRADTGYWILDTG
jgi:hypothetical protein